MNRQPLERQTLTDGRYLDVMDIWYTMQGEGPFAGCPAIFVRLAGCNLSKICHGCDTNYTQGRKTLALEEVIDRMYDHLPNKVDDNIGRKLIVFTGGEPFRQNITHIVRGLLAGDWTVQIETNGTFHLKDFPYDECMVVCSPKTPQICEGMVGNIHALKYILDARHVDEEDGLPTQSLHSGIRPMRPWASFDPYEIYVQPEDTQDQGQNILNRDAAVKSCMKFGYRLSLQLHKIIGVP